VIGLGAFVWYYFSPLYTDVGYRPKQPVPFSHQLHAGNMGMDCRYCHNTVEEAGHAAIPPTSTCLGCHGADTGQIASNKRSLQPIRDSDEKNGTGTPVEWVRVHMLPDYAYFNHAVHVKAGVGCVSCHGRIDQMEVVYQAQPLSMGWCLDCHRAPAEHIRPDSVSVTNMSWNRELALKENSELAAEIEAKAAKVNPPEHCSGCHR